MKNFIKLFIYALCYTCIGLLPGCASKITADMPVYKEIPNKSKIPNGYKSYTLLLFPSYSKSNRLSDAKYNELLSSFQHLGKSIGSSNLAVSFRTPYGEYETQRARAIIDHLKSRKDLKLANINYDTSVLIIYISYNPEEINDSNGYYSAIWWNKEIDIDKIEKFMDELAQLIRNDEIGPNSLEYTHIVSIIFKFIEKHKEDLFRLGEIITNAHHK